MKKKIMLSLLASAFFLGAEVSADSVTRLYNAADGNHWFTTDANKVNSLAAEGWNVEGTAFEAASSGNPVYVVTSPTGYYHFTSNMEEISGLLNKGWTIGKTVFYASNSGVPVYRMYNPNTGTHHFTTNTDEIAGLVSQGWNNEDVAYYVTGQAASSSQVAVKGNYFIDVSSHNGSISVAEYQSLISQGITGVTVKLTEGTSYTNPYAQSQIANAKAAGMRISVYHYSHYTSESEAVTEARYFVQVAKSLGLGADTVMVGDIEEDAMVTNINTNIQAWTDEMKRLGYHDIVYYTGARWMDFKSGPISTEQFGAQNFWLAHYPKGYTTMTQEEALDYSYYSGVAAWQYTSVSDKLAKPLDESIDYTGRFTTQ